MEVDVEEVKRVITSLKDPKPKRKACPKEIPPSVTLDEILNSLPKEVCTMIPLHSVHNNYTIVYLSINSLLCTTSHSTTRNVYPSYTSNRCLHKTV